MTKLKEILILFVIAALAGIAAYIILYAVLAPAPLERSSIERNPQGQRLDFDRCATILQWTEECLP